MMIVFTIMSKQQLISFCISGIRQFDHQVLYSKKKKKTLQV